MSQFIDSAAFKPFNFPPASTSDAPTTPFGSSGGVSFSPLFGTCSTDASGSSPLFGVNSKLASGGSTSSTLLGEASTPQSGVHSSPLFGIPNTPASCAHAPETSTFGASSSPVFGPPRTAAPCSSSSPLFGTSSTSGPTSTQLFGASSTQASGPFSSPLFGQSSAPASTSQGFGLFNASSSSIFGASNNSAFGASTSPSFGTPFTSVPNVLEYGPRHNPFHVPTKLDFTSSACSFGASGNLGCFSFGTPTCGVSNPPFNISTTFKLPASSNRGFSASGSPFVTSRAPSFGTFSTTATTGGFGSTSTPAFGLCNSSFGGFGASPSEQYHGPYFCISCSSCAGRHGSQLLSEFTSWSPFWKDPVRLTSICEMLPCNNINMSYEELRWHEYCRRSKKGESNKLAHVNRIGDTDSDLITIKIEIPSQVATQLLDALRSLHISADSSSTSHSKSASMFAIPFSNPTRTEVSASQSGRQPFMFS